MIFISGNIFLIYIRKRINKINKSYKMLILIFIFSYLFLLNASYKYLLFINIQFNYIII